MDPFLGEIRAVGFNFAPTNWALCEGQLLPVRSYTALFSILGTSFGGDGVNTFGLPNLKARVPIHRGQGPGLSNYTVGQNGGVPTVMMVGSNLTAHSHAMACYSQPASVASPVNATWAASASGRTPPPLYVSAPVQSSAPLSVNAIGFAGGGQPHNNISPYLAVYFIIALAGVFPPHS